MIISRAHRLATLDALSSGAHLFFLKSIASRRSLESVFWPRFFSDIVSVFFSWVFFGSVSESISTGDDRADPHAFFCEWPHAFCLTDDPALFFGPANPPGRSAQVFQIANYKFEITDSSKSFAVFLDRVSALLSFSTGSNHH